MKTTLATVFIGDSSCGPSHLSVADLQDWWERHAGVSWTEDTKGLMGEQPVEIRHVEYDQIYLADYKRTLVAVIMAGGEPTDNLPAMILVPPAEQNAFVEFTTKFNLAWLRRFGMGIAVLETEDWMADLAHLMGSKSDLPDSWQRGFAMARQVFTDLGEATPIPEAESIRGWERHFQAHG